MRLDFKNIFEIKLYLNAFLVDKRDDVKSLLQSVINGNEKLVSASFDKETLIVTTEDKGETFEWTFSPEE